MSRRTDTGESPAALGAAWAEHRVPLMAALAAKLGDLDRAEDALSEAVLRAQQSWAVSLPDNPSGWLYRVALNAAHDARRKTARHASAEPAVSTHLSQTDGDALAVSSQARLALFGRCADPSLSHDQQIALMLFHLAGLDCTAIARAFMVSDHTIHQRLSRARKRLKTRAKAETPPDLSTVRSALEVIYLQSYRDAGGGTEADALGRDALQLTGALCEAGPDEAESWALFALLGLLESRRRSRLTETGDFVPFEAQDPAGWSGSAMRQAAAAMQRATKLSSLQGLSPQPYALRAQIEMTRMLGLRAGRSCDAELLPLYDRLVAASAAPFAQVDRALVLGRLHGARADLDALDALSRTVDLSGHAGWHLARAELHGRKGDRSEARFHVKAAMNLIDGATERAFVRTKLKAFIS